MARRLCASILVPLKCWILKNPSIATIGLTECADGRRLPFRRGRSNDGLIPIILIKFLIYFYAKNQSDESSLPETQTQL